MLFITGCHRSGTSLMASIVNQSAQAKGFRNSIQRENMLPPRLDNPTGFYESNALHEVSKSIMELFGSSWDSPWLEPPDFTKPEVLKHLAVAREQLRAHLDSDFWIDKNPTLCLTLGAFDHIFLNRVPVIATLRNPFGVAESLHLRNGFSWNKSLIIWTYYNYHLWLDNERTPLDCFDCSEYNENSLLLSTRLSLSLNKVLAKEGDHELNPNDIRSCIDNIYVNGTFRDFDITPRRASIDPELSEACHSAWEDMRSEFSKGNAEAAKIRNILQEPLVLALRASRDADGFTTSTSRLQRLYVLRNDHDKLRAERDRLKSQRDQLNNELKNSNTELSKAQNEARSRHRQLQFAADNAKKYQLLAEAWKADCVKAVNKLEMAKSNQNLLLMVVSHGINLNLRLLLLLSRLASAKNYACESKAPTDGTVFRVTATPHSSPEMFANTPLDHPTIVM